MMHFAERIPLVKQLLTVFGHRDFKDVIKVTLGHKGETLI